MAKLFTNHDPFHIHKTLGFLALINIAWRLIAFFWRGYAFCQVGNDVCSKEEIQFDVASVIVHGLLSWSSLMLPVPAKRNFKAPMIWLEFRWHSIIFASRSVLATVISILGLWPEHAVLKFVTKMALVMGTCYAADLATKLYGCTEKRTTNAMVYPDYITPELQQKIKLNYSFAQFAATIACCMEDPSLAFPPLYAIQGAAFLMTLRRKNLIGTRTFHLIYQLQLCVMYLPTLLFLTRGASRDYLAELFLTAGMTMLATYLRIDKRYSKTVVWGTILAIYEFVHATDTCWNFLIWQHTHPVGIAYVLYSHCNETQRFLRHFAPIFIGRALEPKGGVPAKVHPTQSFVRDMAENDLLAFPTRRQRISIMVLSYVASQYASR